MKEAPPEDSALDLNNPFHMDSFLKAYLKSF